MWDAAVFVLNALAFIVVGLELGPIMDRLGRAHHIQYIAFAIAILATVIVARAGWVMTYNIALRLTNRVLGRHTPRAMKPPLFKRSLLVAWCGMRGIVTLAAALALPDGSGSAPAFPYRDLIVLTAFSVVLGTLVIQGLTLRPLVMMLGLDDDGPVESEIRAGRKEMFKAALESLGEHDTDVAVTLRREYSDLLGRADGVSDGFFRKRMKLRPPYAPTPELRRGSASSFEGLQVQIGDVAFNNWKPNWIWSSSARMFAVAGDCSWKDPEIAEKPGL